MVVREERTVIRCACGERADVALLVQPAGRGGLALVNVAERCHDEMVETLELSGMAVVSAYPIVGGVR